MQPHIMTDDELLGLGEKEQIGDVEVEARKKPEHQAGDGGHGERDDQSRTVHREPV